MTKEQLTDLTIWLKDNVWRNSEVQYPCTMSDSYNVKAELIDIISSLHNLLYEEVFGHRYNYAFHWCNKVGADTEDNIFDDLLNKTTAEDLKQINQNIKDEIDNVKEFCEKWGEDSCHEKEKEDTLK